MHVVTNARGEAVMTVLDPAGVRLWKGWRIHQVDRPAGPGERWCPEREGWHAHEEEAAVHAAASAEPVTPAMFAALAARVAAMENLLREKTE